MKILRLAAFAGKLKRISRAGWIKEHVKDPESVAEHSYRLALMTMFASIDREIDQAKAIKMALVHDLAESQIGDIITQIGAQTLPNLTEKLAKERSAMEEISQEIESVEPLALLDEYNENKTPEARLVRQLDRMEMLIQAYEYENEQQLKLGEFFITAQHDITDPELVSLLQEVELSRNEK